MATKHHSATSSEARSPQDELVTFVKEWVRSLQEEADMNELPLGYLV